MYGHRLRDCRKKDEEMRAKRGGLNSFEGGEEEEYPEEGYESQIQPWMILQCTRVEKKSRCPPCGRFAPLIEDEEEEDESNDDEEPGQGTGRKWAKIVKKGAGRRKKDKRGEVKCLVRKGSRDLCALRDEDEEWECIEVMVDSGASESVAPKGRFDAEVTDGQAKKDGVKYTAANGEEIPNLGEQMVKAKTYAGQLVEVKFQVADVNKPLLSVAQLASRGNNVEFNHAGGRIIHKATGRVIPFQRKHGVYVLRLYVKKSAAEKGFQRQVRR